MLTGRLVIDYQLKRKMDNAATTEVVDDKARKYD